MPETTIARAETAVVASATPATAALVEPASTQAAPIALAKLKGIDRAAVLLMALGEEYAAEILKHMEPRELHKVGAAMASVSNIHRGQVSEVLAEFNQQVDNQTSMGVDSREYIRGVLVRAVGRDKAKGVLESILNNDNAAGVDALKWMDSEAIASGLCEEHPQVVALVLSSLDSQQAAEVVSLLPAELRYDALMRVATLDSIPADALAELNDLIEKQVLGKISAAATTKMGGPKRAAEIMNLLGSEVEGPIMTKLKEFDGAVAQKIEDLMVVFDSLLEVQDRGIQALLREVSSENLLIALRGADEMLRQKILRNMSKRAAEMLRDDLETMQPVKLSDVESAQREIMAAAKRLADAGQLTLGRKGGDQFV
ncbi:MAG: flagellar motor switch protein FliG [Gammaproteobacteria bacterium]